MDNNSAANSGFKVTLWDVAGSLNNTHTTESKHVVLGQIFLKYISNAFETNHAELDA